VLSKKDGQLRKADKLCLVRQIGEGDGAVLCEARMGRHGHITGGFRYCFLVLLLTVVKT